MTTTELLLEYSVIYETRLGSLCGAGKPTPEQERIAHEEADAHIKELVAQGD